MKTLFLSILIFSLTACVVKQEILPGNFDKKQWRYSSHYRFEVTKTKEFFSMVEGKSRREVKRLLGPPDLVDSVRGTFIYCIDIPIKRVCRCEGSLLSIDFVKGSPYNIILVREESYKK